MQDILLFVQHHLALFTALAAILVVLIMIEFNKLKRSANRVSPAQATQLINHQKAVVIDIRTPDAFSSGHIIGAVSFPLSEISNKSKKFEKFKINPIIVVCNAGMESPKAAALLIKQGYRILILAGGMRAWRDAQMPIVKG